MAFAGEFEIDIISALSSQLVDAFENLDIAPLKDIEKPGYVEKGRQGVYHLFQHKSLVYVGKANDLQKRLKEHRTKIAGRRNITVDEMSFRCLYIHKNWTTLAPETALITYYQEKDLCEWNGSSFGPHDPGRERETTNKPPHGFDASYPIRADWILDGIEARPWNARELLIEVKSQLPYLLRFQVSNSKSYKRGHEAYNDLTIPVDTTGLTAEEMLRLLARNIPGAQGTIFDSHMILYLEQRRYDFGRVV